ncbi:hypothetical protein BLOT_013173 [Blomia tropicalis]|nr:hypothetical protein BLOT_013173 [Blomia tropicalis]
MKRVPSFSVSNLNLKTIRIDWETTTTAATITRSSFANVNRHSTCIATIQQGDDIGWVSVIGTNHHTTRSPIDSMQWGSVFTASSSLYMST